MTTQTTNPGDLVVTAVRHLFDSGVMSHAGHANLSARLDAERFALTTTGMVRDLRPDQLAAAAIGGAVDFPAGALDAVRASMARVQS